jgi:hypothetical protein
MDRALNLISVEDFQTLLNDLKLMRPDICIRYRMLGELWSSNFVSVISVIDKAVLLRDETRNALISITDISSIMQFEIDKPFIGYQPYFHYEVKPFIPIKHQVASV